MSSTNFTHLDAHGQAQMVDVSGKAATVREAVAEARVRILPNTQAMLLNKEHPKGDVFAVARIAGIQAAKRTHELIPLCHALLLSSVNVQFSTPSDSVIVITTQCRLQGQTGVEMEALTAASVAALTLYDMCKAVDRGMVIEHIRLLEKLGGASGHFHAEPLAEDK